MNRFPVKNISIKKLSILFVYIAVSLLAISDSGVQLLILHTIGPYSRTLRLIAMWLLFAKVLLTRYSKKEFFLLVPLSVLALYNYTLAGNIYCVYCILVIASLKEVDYPTLFKSLFWSTFGTLLFVGVLSFLGIGSPIQLTQDFGRGVVETRYCIGLYHPNIWHFAIGRCIIYFCLGYYKKLNFIHLIAAFILNYFVYTLSVSRTGFLSASIFLIIVFCYKYLNKIMHWLIVKIGVIVGVLSVYSLYIYFAYDYAVNYSLNSQLFDWKVTTGRIQQAIHFLETHPIQMFASRFPDDGTLFDCGFFRIFYECGYLWAGLLFAAFFLILIRSLKNHWDMIIPVCIFFVFYSLYEIDPITRPTYNVLIFFYALLIYCSDHFQRRVVKRIK